MLFEGAFSVESPRETVADFFSRLDNMSLIIPGCVEHQAMGPDEVAMVIEQKVAFLKGRFAIKMRVMENKLPDEISAEADGRDSLIGSSLKIKDTLRLEETAPGQTTVHYRMDVSVFGKLGNLGFFIIKSKAKEMEQDFVVATRAVLEGLNKSES